MNKLEILHVRNSDDACDVIVYIDGRGYTVEDWDESTEWDTSPERGQSDAFSRAVVDAYASGRDSEYVVED